MDPPQQLTPALSVDNSPSLSDSESTFGIPPEQVDIIRSIVDKWHKKPLQIASDIVSALVYTSSPQRSKTTTNNFPGRRRSHPHPPHRTQRRRPRSSRLGQMRHRRMRKLHNHGLGPQTQTRIQSPKDRRLRSCKGPRSPSSRSSRCWVDQESVWV
jgi:hypothetical protein